MHGPPLPSPSFIVVAGDEDNGSSDRRVGVERATGEGRGSGVDRPKQGGAAQPRRSRRSSAQSDHAVEGSAGEATGGEDLQEAEGGGGRKRGVVKAVVGVVVAAVYYAVWAVIAVTLG